MQKEGSRRACRRKGQGLGRGEAAGGVTRRRAQHHLYFPDRRKVEIERMETELKETKPVATDEALSSHPSRLLRVLAGNILAS